MTTMITTAKLNDVEPQVWLANVLARIADHTIENLTSFCPGTGSRAQPKSPSEATRDLHWMPSFTPDAAKCEIARCENLIKVVALRRPSHTVASRRSKPSRWAPPRDPIASSSITSTSGPTVGVLGSSSRIAVVGSPSRRCSHGRHRRVYTKAPRATAQRLAD
jgi:hypothetical protein